MNDVTFDVQAPLADYLSQGKKDKQEGRRGEGREDGEVPLIF